MTFVGHVDSAPRARRPTDRSGRKHLITSYPLGITNESDRHRKVVLDLFGFSCASDEELVAVGHRFARNGDLIELDAIATGSGVLVVRQAQRVTVVTDLAGVWPVFIRRAGCCWLIPPPLRQDVPSQSHASTASNAWPVC